jgi:hypothetical protein
MKTAEQIPNGASWLGRQCLAVLLAAVFASRRTVDCAIRQQLTSGVI